MEEKSQCVIRYTYIPNEICQVIEFDGVNVPDITYISDIATCIYFKCETLSFKNICNLINEIRKSYNKHIAISIQSNILPFYSKYFDYIQINDGLYVNVSKDEMTTRFVDITSAIPTKETLNPMDLYYFEMYNELKNKNEN